MRARTFHEGWAVGIQSGSPGSTSSSGPAQALWGQAGEDRDGQGEKDTLNKETVPF